MKYVVYNKSSRNVSFKVQPMACAMPMVNIASHHRRRLTKGTAHNILIKSNLSKDLIKETGLTESDLDYCSELQGLIKKGYLIRVIEEAPVEAPMVAPVLVSEEVPVQVAEEVPMVAPVVVPEEAAEEVPMVAPVQVVEEETEGVSEEAPVEAPKRKYKKSKK